jgi:hypothetical protein
MRMRCVECVERKMRMKSGAGAMRRWTRAWTKKRGERQEVKGRR